MPRCATENTCADHGKWYAELSDIIINTIQKEIIQYISIHYHTTQNSKHELNEQSVAVQAEWRGEGEGEE